MGGQGFIFEPSASSVALNPLSAAPTLCYHDTWDLLGTYFMTQGTYFSSFAAPIIQTGPFKVRNLGNLIWNSRESHFCMFWAELLD